MYTMPLLMIIIMGIIVIYMYTPDIQTVVISINNFFSKHCTDPDVFNTKDFSWTQDFRDNWRLIREEFFNYSNNFVIPSFKNIDPVNASCNIMGDWKTVFLRAYGVDTNLTKLFPKTMELINMAPCTLAFFSVLEPGTKLAPHVGVYKGVIRYHLSLIVPDQWNKCFINVNGKFLHWRQGQDMLFDDLFLHYVENNTDQRRVVLFLDIKRDFRNPLINLINSIFLRFIKSNDIISDIVSNANTMMDKKF